MVFHLSLGNFYGIDSLVEFLIVVVSFVISYYSHKVYNLVKENNYRFFSWAFLLLGISFIFKILSNLTIFHRFVVENANFIFIIWHQLESTQLINFFSFILYKTLHVAGFLILFLIITKTDKKEKIFLYLYLSLLAVLFSVYFNFIFHLTLVLILAFLVEYFYQNHKKVKSGNSKLVFNAFLVMLVAYLFFVFSDVHSLFYVSGEILLLIGFLLLLINQINLKKQHGKQKNKVGNHKGHVRSFAKKSKS